MTTNTYTVKLRKERATWYWFVKNPQGGGFGSNHCGAKGVALGRALQSIPAGAPYIVVTNGRKGESQVK